MAYELSNMKYVDSHPFTHNHAQEAERHYDHLRDLARQAAGKRASCFDRARQAYAQGDGEAAHALSEQGKNHGAQMEIYNREASEFIFRETNAEGRVEPDTIDPHGQLVEEAEDILKERIGFARSTGQTHLHVIVGKGNHSPHHMQKIRPKVEKVCQELGLRYQTEANEGRVYINLTGGSANASPQPHIEAPKSAGGHQYFQSRPSHPAAAQQQHGVYRPHHPPHHNQHHGQAQDDEVEKIVKKLLPRILRKVESQCCVVM